MVELARFHTLRQQQAKTGDKPYLALADYIAPDESGIGDYLGLFAVTAGHGTESNESQKRQKEGSRIQHLLRENKGRQHESVLYPLLRPQDPEVDRHHGRGVYNKIGELRSLKFEV